MAPAMVSSYRNQLGRVWLLGIWFGAEASEQLDRLASHFAQQSQHLRSPHPPDDPWPQICAESCPGKPTSGRMAIKISFEAFPHDEPELRQEEFPFPSSGFEHPPAPHMPEAFGASGLLVSSKNDVGVGASGEACTNGETITNTPAKTNLAMFMLTPNDFPKKRQWNSKSLTGWHYKTSPGAGVTFP